MCDTGNTTTGQRLGIAWQQIMEDGVRTKEEAVEMLVLISFLSGAYAMELSSEHALRTIGNFDVREIEGLWDTYERMAAEGRPQ